MDEEPSRDRVKFRVTASRITPAGTMAFSPLPNNREEKVPGDTMVLVSIPGTRMVWLILHRGYGRVKQAGNLSRSDGSLSLDLRMLAGSGRGVGEGSRLVILLERYERRFEVDWAVENMRD